MKFIFHVFVFTSFLLELGMTSNILVLCPLVQHSIHTLAFSLARELAGRGHEVTFVNAHPQEKPIKNLTEISVAELRTIHDGFKKTIYEVGKMSYINLLLTVSRYGASNIEKVFRVKEVQELLKSNKKFDLVIFTHLLNEALLIFPYKFNCPSVILEPLPATIFSNHFFANPSPSSYVPNILSNFGSRMSIWERLVNIYYEIVGQILLHYVILPGQEAILRRSVPGAPRLQNIMYNSSLMFVASHRSTHAPVPLQPAIKEIGGFHIEPTKPLPADLQKFLDNSKEGVVLFSMGSNLKSADFTQEKKDMVLKVFSELKQKVLWKFETDLPRKPENVKISNWLPQRDILAHPNILVFISHGGLLGTTEAVHYGVPLLCMPVFWDQRRNCDDAERMGVGLKVSFHEFTEQDFRLALNKLINNPKYRENAKMRSKILHDQPVKQMDKAVFWIEYVIRHKGAPHLRSSGLDLEWYQIYFVDVILFLALISFACLVVVFYVFRCVFGMKRKIKNVKTE